MDSKQKVSDALSFKQGKVPLDMGGTPTSGIHISTLEKLRQGYGLEKRLPKVIEPFQMLGMVEDDLRQAIGCDTAPFWGRLNMFGFENEGWKKFMTPWGQEVLVPGKFVTKKEGDKTYLYAKGDENFPPSMVMPDSGFFFDSVPRDSGFDEDNLDPADNLEEFGVVGQADLDHYKKLLREYKGSEYALCANFGGTGLGDIALVPGPGMTNPRGIRNVEEWYVSTVIRQDHLRKIFDRQTQIALYNLEKIYEVVGDSVCTAFVCGTDYGAQRAPMCSPETFRELYSPYYKIINDWIHSNTKWKTFKHSCGAIEPLMKDIIDAGFDIINPVQWTAQGMDAAALKEKYGKDIVFWGGGIDTQKTLPFGTPQEVRDETLRMCEVFSKGGGFVFATVHNIQAMTPVDNLLAMFEAFREFNE